MLTALASFAPSPEPDWTSDTKTLADCATSLPPHDVATVDPGNPRRFLRSTEWKKATGGNRVRRGDCRSGRLSLPIVGQASRLSLPVVGQASRLSLPAHKPARGHVRLLPDASRCAAANAADGSPHARSRLVSNRIPWRPAAHVRRWGMGTVLVVIEYLAGSARQDRRDACPTARQDRRDACPTVRGTPAPPPGGQEPCRTGLPRRAFSADS